MLPFDITILGSNAAMPMHGRFPTSQIVTIQHHVFMVDCGEGTQIRLNDFDIRRGKINQIFISHLHGDHYFGLFGLLGSYSLQGRTAPLHIYCPDGLQHIIQAQYEHAHMKLEWLSYPLHFHIIDTTKQTVIFENKDVIVETIPLLHEIPTCGFLFKERERPRKMRGDKMKEHNIHFKHIPSIKDGADYTKEDGTVIPNSELTLAVAPPRKYAYCSDTAYFEDIIPIIEGVDLLYHETTFSQEYFDALENPPHHSTPTQAATIAKKAKVKKLIIGHFSQRYRDLNPLLEEAQAVFENSELAIEGEVFKC